MTLEEIRRLPMDEVVKLLEICRKDMRLQDEEGYLTSFANVIGAITVEREFGPPEKYSEQLWCSWRFRVEERP